MHAILSNQSNQCINLKTTFSNIQIKTLTITWKKLGCISTRTCKPLGVVEVYVSLHEPVRREGLIQNLLLQVKPDELVVSGTEPIPRWERIKVFIFVLFLIKIIIWNHCCFQWTLVLRLGCRVIGGGNWNQLDTRIAILIDLHSWIPSRIRHWHTRKVSNSLFISLRKMISRVLLWTKCFSLVYLKKKSYIWKQIIRMKEL